MTKQHIIQEISRKTGIEKYIVQATVEQFMRTIKNAMLQGEFVYLREFGTFMVKKRESKLARDIRKKTFVVVPAHYIPYFKPSRKFADKVKKTLKPAQSSR